MPEWIYEAGIGETRAALIDGGEIIEAAIELDDPALRVGTVADARLAELLPQGRIVTLNGQEALLDRVPPRTSLGAPFRVRIVREAIPEPGRAKRAKAVATDEPLTPGPDLIARLHAAGHPVRRLQPHEPDALEAAGWSELLDEALTGEIAFPGGALRLSPTPAMTLFDVDGSGPLEALAIAGAQAAAKAIRRMGIGGSIGLDLPTLAGKGPRNAVAAALDAALPPPFERTAMNGFGFLQIIRPRPRASLPELLRADPVAAAARMWLRHAEREPPGSPARSSPPPGIRADHLAELTRRTGVDWTR